MNKKFFAAVITAVAVFSQMIISVYAESNVFDYTAGAREYSVNVDDFNGDAEILGDGIMLSENGSVMYEIFLPFDSSSVSIEYRCSENSVLKLSANDIEYTLPVISNENKTDISFKSPLRAGEISLRINVERQTVVKNLTFNKVSKKTAMILGFSENELEETSYSEYENDLQSTIVLNTDSPVIKVGNAKRYIDYDDTKAKPVSLGERIYIPVITLARAFGYYVECDEKNNWLLLRNDTYEYILKNSESYLKRGGEKYKTEENVIITENEKYYAPIEYFAEKSGFTYIKSGNYAVIGYKSLVKKAIEQHMTEIENEFSEYIKASGISNIYHVSKSENASDSGTGDELHPFFTLNKAASVARAGDTVIVHNGIYRETLRPSASGTAGNPITFKAADGEKPVISTLEPIGEPDETEGYMSVYTPGWDLGEGRNLVFYDGEAIAEARHPNSNTVGKNYLDDLNLSSLWQTMGNISVQKGMTAISNTDLNQPENFWNGATLISFNGRAWSLAASKIEKSEPGRLTLTEACERFWFDDEPRDGDWAYITNTKNAIDVPGEWFWGRDKKLYIYLPDNIPADKLEGKKRQSTVNLKNRKYINIENIDTIGGGMILSGTQMCVINGGEHKYVGHYTYTRDQQYGYISDANKFNLTGPPQNGELGIYMGGDSDAVINAHIAYSAGSGIYATGKYGYIENNLIEDCGYMGGYMGGIFMTATGVSNSKENVSRQRGGFGIYNNTVRRAGRAVFEIASIENPWWNAYGQEPYIASEIAYNDFSDSSIAARDTGVVYMHGTRLGTDRKHFKFHDNTVWDSWSCDKSNMGIYFDNCTQQGEVYNNIVFYTNKNIPYTGGEVFVQTNGGFKNSFASIDDMNNTKLGYLPGGKKDLTKNDFPEGKRFVSGCNPDFDKSMDEFNPDGYEYSMNKAEVKGAACEDGFIVMENDESQIRLPDIDFGDNMNAVRISYSGDCYSIPSAFEIAFGESYEKSEKKGVMLKTTSVNKNQTDSDTFVLPVKGGVHNIYITKKGGAAVKIKSVQPILTDSSEYEAYANSTVYAANYASVSGERENFGTLYGEKCDVKKMLVNNTYGGTVLKYENVYVPEASDYLTFSAGTTKEYSGSVIKVHIDDILNEPIGAVEINKDTWKNFTPQIIKLKNTLDCGIYTVWLEFCGSSYTSDFWWFSFVSEYDKFAFPDCDRYVNAILYSNTNSSEVNLAQNYIGSLDSNVYVVYNNVDFGEKTDKLRVKMGVSPNYEGAIVRIWRLNSYNDEAISVKNGNINSEFAEQIAEFTATSTGGFIQWGDFDVGLSKEMSGKNTVVFTFSKNASGCFKGFLPYSTKMRSAYKTLNMENADIVKPNGTGGWLETYYKQDEEGQWCIGETNAYAVFRDVDFTNDEPFSIYFEYAYRNSVMPHFVVWQADELSDENAVIDSVGSGEIYVTGADGKQYYHNLGTTSGILATGRPEICSAWKRSVSKTLRLPVVNSVKGKHTIIVAIFDNPAFLYNIRFSKEPIKKYAYTDTLGIGNYERANGVGINKARSSFTSLDAGDEILWKNVDFGSSEENVMVRLTAAMPAEYAGRPMTVMIDGKEAARFVLEDTGGWFEFEEFEKELNFKVSGVHDVSMKFYAVGTGTVKSLAFERHGYSVNVKNSDGVFTAEIFNNSLSGAALDIDENSDFYVGIYEGSGNNVRLCELYKAKEISSEYIKAEFDSSRINNDCTVKLFLLDRNTLKPLAVFSAYKMSEISTATSK